MDQSLKDGGTLLRRSVDGLLPLPVPSARIERRAHAGQVGISRSREAVQDEGMVGEKNVWIEDKVVRRQKSIPCSMRTRIGSSTKGL